MIKMVDKQSILSRYGSQSTRQIARELGINRKTVERYIREYESVLRKKNDEDIEDYLSQKPKYQTGNRPRRVITEAIKSKISWCLQQNKQHRSNNMHKQCMAKMDIYELLINQGFDISYPTVCKYIVYLEKTSRSPHEAYIRAHYEPGEVCEFDWGEVKLNINGKLETKQMAVFTLAHSNARFCYLFSRQDTLAFMEAHRNFFQEAKGVPLLMVYDNMRVAIKKFVGNEKHPTDALVKLKTFYRFNHRFCNICSGNEKGHVERSVEVIRRKAFSYKTKFPSIDDANEYLSDICTKMNNKKGVVVELDLDSLRRENNRIACFESSSYKVDKWSTICMKAVHYSVPDNLVGKLVDVKIYSDRITVFYENKKVSVHQRIYIQGQWSVKLEHYIATLTKKPGAVFSSLALKQADNTIRKLFNDCFKDTPRDFVILVDYLNNSEYSVDDVLQAHTYLKETQCIANPSADQIKVILSNLKELKTGNAEEYSSIEFKVIEDQSMNTLTSLTDIMNNKAPDYDTRAH